MIKFYLFLEKNFLKLIQEIENKKSPLIGWFLTFFAIVFLRQFLDIFSRKTVTYHAIFNYFHAPFYMLSGFLFIVILIHLLSKEKIDKMLKLGIFGSLILLIPPIVDLIISKERLIMIQAYSLDLNLFRMNLFELIESFKDWILYGYFGILLRDASEFTQNFGTRVNVLIFGLCSIIYVFVKTKNVFKLIIGFLFFYLTTFVITYLPNSISSLFSEKIFDTDAGISTINSLFSGQHGFAAFFIIYSLFLSLICLYFYNKFLILYLIKKIEFKKYIYVSTLFFLGVIIAKDKTILFNTADYLLILTALVSILLYEISITLKNIPENDVDLSKKELLEFNKKDFNNAGNILLSLSFVTAFIASYKFFVLFLLRTLISYIYCKPPLEIKKIIIIKQLTIALISFIIILSGFSVFENNNIFDFPIYFRNFIIFFITIIFLTKDIVDFNKDKEEKNHTIATLLGLEKSKKIISFVISFLFFFIPLIFFEHFKILFIPSLLIAVLSFFLINKKTFNENQIFSIYFVYGLFFVITILKIW